MCACVHGCARAHVRVHVHACVCVCAGHASRALPWPSLLPAEPQRQQDVCVARRVHSGVGLSRVDVSSTTVDSPVLGSAFGIGQHNCLFQYRRPHRWSRAARAACEWACPGRQGGQWCPCSSWASLPVAAAVQICAAREPALCGSRSRPAPPSLTRPLCGGCGRAWVPRGHWCRVSCGHSWGSPTPVRDPQRCLRGCSGPGL